MCFKKRQNVLHLGSTKCTYKSVAKSGDSNVYYNVKFEDSIYKNHKFIVSDLIVYNKLILQGDVFFLHFNGTVKSYYIDVDKNIVEQ